MSPPHHPPLAPACLPGADRCHRPARGQGPGAERLQGPGLRVPGRRLRRPQRLDSDGGGGACRVPPPARRAGPARQQRRPAAHHHRQRPGLCAAFRPARPAPLVGAGTAGGGGQCRPAGGADDTGADPRRQREPAQQSVLALGPDAGHPGRQRLRRRHRLGRAQRRRGAGAQWQRQLPGRGVAVGRRALQRRRAGRGGQPDPRRAARHERLQCLAAERRQPRAARRCPRSSPSTAACAWCRRRTRCGATPSSSTACCAPAAAQAPASTPCSPAPRWAASCARWRG